MHYFEHRPLVRGLKPNRRVHLVLVYFSTVNSQLRHSPAQYSRMSTTTTLVTEERASSLKGVPFVVSPPFVSDPGANVVLRSCDKYEFRARKAILSFGSAYFDDIFSRPHFKERESGISTDDSIELSETGLVIDTLLQYCYPLANPSIVDFGLSTLVLRAAEKYRMAVVVSEIIAASHKQRLTHPDILLFLYRRACDLRQEAEAREYAWECLTLSYSSIVKHGQGSLLDNALPNLIDYHHIASKEIGEYISDFDSIYQLAHSMWQRCEECNIILLNRKVSLEPIWWRYSLASSLQELYKNGPRSRNILRRKLNNSKLCNYGCQNKIFQCWDKFEKRYIQAIEEKAKKVWNFNLLIHFLS